MAAEGAIAFDPVALDEADKALWDDVWDTACDDAAVEMGIEKEWFGSLLAGVVAEEQGEPGLNFILGAAGEPPEERRHLEQAVRWVESHGVDYRVPMIPGLSGVAEAEKWFFRHGNSRLQGPARLVRDGSHPEFAPPAVEVLERRPSEDEYFGVPLAESLRLPSWASNFFLGLQGKPRWRCCCAIDGDEALAYLAMIVDEGVAELILASRPSAREADGLDAVLYRALADAASAGCRMIAVAEAGSAPAVSDREALLRAGFEEAFGCFTWQPGVPVTI